jgi:hypothetical protein
MATKCMAYGVTSNPSADYILAWSKDVDDSTKVREGGACVSDCTRSDGVGRGSSRGRGVCGISITVTGSNLENFGSRINIS